mgnify:CR=1 FL=1
MKLRGMPLTLRCPEHGFLSLRCAHPELANRPLGFAIMVIGAWIIALGLTEVL